MRQIETTVPATRAAVLDPAWLGLVLGRVVTAVEVTEVIVTMATKVRFVATYADGERQALCLKGFLDLDPAILRGGGETTLREADFYAAIAPQTQVRVPALVAAATDRTVPCGVIVMRDLIGDGARFCSALEPFGADDAAASLGQLARLHAASHVLDAAPWITPRLAQMVERPIVPEATLQDLLDGPRGEGLLASTRDAARLMRGVAALAVRDAARPAFLVHGDAHAGNIYRTAEGPGLIDWQLIQRGGWALDVAYHLAAVLPVDVAAQEERRLLTGYLTEARALGCGLPDAEEAWRQYREALVYGLYLWGVTRRVEPEIIDLFVGRLGAAVERCGSFTLLEVGG